MGRLGTWFRSAIKSSFVRNVAIVTSGTVLGQSIMIAASPILSRIYKPEDFGAFAVFASTVGILAIIASLRYEIAIPLPESDEEAWSLAKLALAGATFFSFVLMITMKGWAKPFAVHMGLSEGQSVIILLIPIGVVLTSAFQTVNYLVIRSLRHRLLAKSKVVQGAVAASSQTGLGLMGIGAVGLVIGLVMGRLASALYAYFSLNIYIKSKKSLWEVAKKYMRFPKLALPSGGVNALAVELPMLLTAAIYGTGIAGLYALAQRVVVAPMGMVGKSIAQVYMAKLGEYVRNNNPQAVLLYSSVAKKLFTISIVPFILLAIFSPYIFGMLFGASWSVTGYIIRLLSPAFFVQFVVAPLSQTLNYIGRQDIQLVWDTLRFIGILIIFYIAKIWKIEYITLFSIYSIYLTIAYILLYIITIYILNKSAEKWQIKKGKHNNENV